MNKIENNKFNNKINSIPDAIIDPQTKSYDEIASFFNTNKTNGLTDEQVKSNQLKYGKNILMGKEKTSIIKRFFNQFKDLMIIILLIAAIVSFIALFFDSNKEIADWVQPFIILAIVIVNAIIGAIQEVKADNAIEALKKLTTDKTRVIRNNKTILIPTDQIVIGDLIYFESGDKIYADARIVDCNSLKVVESSLTGESTPVEKSAATIWKNNTPLGDRNNMLYSSSLVVNGSGTAIVTNIGMKTEIGKIAGMIQSVQPESTPLQKQLSKFSKWIAIVCVIIAIIVLGIEFAQLAIENSWEVKRIIDSIMVAISLAVAAIPEGLPLVITICMSLGATKMAKNQAIIKNLPCVEVLGSTSVICTDKTGTLTQNKMTLTNFYDLNTHKNINLDDKQNEDIMKKIGFACLCCNASIEKSNMQGDPTELAIIKYFNDHSNKSLLSLKKQYIEVEELPFDSYRKLMSVIVKFNNKYLVITKGAYDELLKCCNKLDKKSINELNEINEFYSSQGKRIIGLAIKELNKCPNNFKPKNIEYDLNFIGLITMIDPPREEVKQSIEDCYQAGINIVMITGDHVLTATAIAKDLNIYKEGDLAITGQQLDKMSDNEFIKKIQNIKVYARVSPENKLRITTTWKKINKVVAMIGDGVNDAPALKKADIGCAMGDSSDVSKDAADVILQNNSFTTITKAVFLGRAIYRNILKVIEFLLSTNLAEVITILTLIFVGLEYKFDALTFSSLQILWINLLTDTFPALALGSNAGDKSLMFDSPRPLYEKILANKLWLKIILEAIMIGLGSISGFIIGYFIVKPNYDSKFAIQVGSTGAFIALALMQIMQIFNVKSRNTVFNKSTFDNKWLNLSALFALAMVLIVVLIPGVCQTFNMQLLYNYGKLALVYLYVALIGVFLPLVWMEITKIIFNKHVYKVKTK